MTNDIKCFTYEIVVMNNIKILDKWHFDVNIFFNNLYVYLNMNALVISQQFILFRKATLSIYQNTSRGQKHETGKQSKE